MFGGTAFIPGLRVDELDDAIPKSERMPRVSPVRSTSPGGLAGGGTSIANATAPGPLGRNQAISAFLENATQVRICFLMDATQSMDSSIKAVKDNFRQVCAAVKEEFPSAKIKAGVVAYRDFDCGASHTELLDFTGDAKVLHTFLDRLTAKGGDDFAEDVFSGLEQSAALSWRKGATQLIFHVADAPCHGLQFHNGEATDKYPGGDPRGRDLRTLLETLYHKCGVKGYFFAHLNSETVTMIEEFRKAAPQREWVKETRVGESSDALIDYLTKSIVTSLIATSAPKENDAFGSSISSACNDSDISARLTSVVLGENDMKSTWKGNVSDDESALSIASRASAGRLEAAAEKISYMKKLVKKCREAGLSDVAETPANRSLGIFVNFAATIAFAFDNGVISARQAEKYREINRAGNLANHEF